MLSERVKKWVRKRLELFAGTYEEGADPPNRIRKQVEAFASLNPHATRAEWIEFAARFSGETYAAGYIRGVEWAEREPDAGVVPGLPEAIADDLDPEWRNVPIGDLRLNDVVPDGFDESAFADEVLDHFRGEEGPKTWDMPKPRKTY